MHLHRPADDAPRRVCKGVLVRRSRCARRPSVPSTVPLAARYNSRMRVILFDIDGTLIHTGGAGGTALFAAFRQLFAVENPVEVPFSGRTDRGICAQLFQAHGIQHTPENWSRLRAGYLEHLAVHLPQRKGRVLAGVADVLRGLQARDDLALGLLTGNMREGARLKLAFYGLHEHFAFGGYGDDHHDRDSVAREAWQAAQQYLNGRSESARVWVVGDTPLDVQCARAIGASVLAVATGSHPSDELQAARPDVLLPDLSNTAEVLRHLTS